MKFLELMGLEVADPLLNAQNRILQWATLVDPAAETVGGHGLRVISHRLKLAQDLSLLQLETIFREGRTSQYLPQQIQSKAQISGGGDQRNAAQLPFTEGAQVPTRVFNDFIDFMGFGVWLTVRRDFPSLFTKR